MNSETWSPIWLSFKCGVFSALLNLPWGIFWGWVLAKKIFPGKTLLQAFLYLPLVLPPVLTGYFLLILFSKNSFLGSWLWSVFHVRVVLDWKGAVLASWLVSSPFMIEMVKQAMERYDQRLELAAQTLGASRFRIFLTLTLPLCLPGIAAGFFLSFAKSMGEFGATIMIAGNIPEKTQTIPLAIYNRVMVGQESLILPLVLAAVIFSYAGLVLSQMGTGRSAK